MKFREKLGYQQNIVETFLKILLRYLAIVSALCCEADYVFFPENPPSRDWPERLCNKLSQVLIRTLKI